MTYVDTDTYNWQVLYYKCKIWWFKQNGYHYHQK